MSVNRWLGDMPAVSKVVTLTVAGTPAGGDVIRYTIGTAVVSYTLIGGDTAATAAAAFYAALAASTDPRFREVAWSYPGSGAVVTGTAAVPGRPFTGTASATGTTTLTQATTTASAGPNHVDLAANWSLGVLPAATNDVLVDQGADGLWGFENLSAAAYASFRVKASFEGRWGLPLTNESGYVEYRGRAHPIATAVPVTIGDGDGNGPTLVNLTHTTAADVTVQRTGARASNDAPAVNLAGMSSGTVSVVSGDVGVAADSDTLSGTVATATLQEGCTLTVGTGATVTTCNNNGGDVVAPGVVTTLVNRGGAARLYRNPTTVTARGGRVVKRFTGTVTTLTVVGGGDPNLDPQALPVFDCTEDPRAVAVTNATFTGGGRLLDPDGTLTWSNAFAFDQASLTRSVLGQTFNILKS